jgi:hypothetical protein
MDICRDATVKCCGVAVAIPQGRAGLLLRRANRSEHGNHPGLPGLRAIRVRLAADRPAWDGAEPL